LGQTPVDGRPQSFQHAMNRRDLDVLRPVRLQERSDIVELRR
jgi:hypothetical protein